MLAAAGVSVQLIQLLGRWTSVSVQRCTQDAGLAVVPDIPKAVLHPFDGPDNGISLEPVIRGLPPEMSSVPSTVALQPARAQRAELPSLQVAAPSMQDVQDLRSELAALKAAVDRPNGAHLGPPCSVA